MENFLEETGASIVHFLCPRGGIGTPVALGREKPKRLHTGFTELRRDHAEK